AARSMAVLLFIFLLLSMAIIWMVALSFNSKTQVISGKQKPSTSEKDKKFRDGIRALVSRHIETLARRRIQLIKIDHYGVIDASEWDAEMRYFIDNVLFPELVTAEIFLPIRQHINSTTADHIKRTFSPMLLEIVEEKSKERAAILETDLTFPRELSPDGFERWCAQTLNAHGWKAICTKTTGDQGADVIAEKAKRRVVLQCKFYTGTVGNKAVQEAYAAQRHYTANASAVVTNATFSPSAKDLANSTGVLLLHYSDLIRLDRLLAS
ncbi:MAG: restriction endonuclease, partial [Xanthobacteraceae bacterium]